MRAASLGTVAIGIGLISMSPYLIMNAEDNHDPFQRGLLMLGYVVVVGVASVLLHVSGIKRGRAAERDAVRRERERQRPGE